jgi:hypothetical protein
MKPEMLSQGITLKALHKTQQRLASTQPGLKPCFDIPGGWILGKPGIQCDARPGLRR